MVFFQMCLKCTYLLSKCDCSFSFLIWLIHVYIPQIFLQAADTENEQRKRLEIAAQNANNKNDEDVAKRNKINQKKQQDAVINELKHKTRMVQEKKLLQQDEVYNGALEDILLGLKSEPYRRADAVRRSQRRRIDNNRLSKTMEEMEFWCKCISTFLYITWPNFCILWCILAQGQSFALIFGWKQW